VKGNLFGGSLSLSDDTATVGVLFARVGGISWVRMQVDLPVHSLRHRVAVQVMLQ
jgi:hypothetical protein